MEDSKNNFNKNIVRKFSGIIKYDGLFIEDAVKSRVISKKSGGHSSGHLLDPTINETNDLPFNKDSVQCYSMPNPEAKRPSKHPKTGFLRKEDLNYVSHRMLTLIGSDLNELFKTECKVKIEMFVREHCLFGEKRVPEVNEWKNGVKQHVSNCTPKSFVMWLIKDDTQIESPIKGFYIETIYPKLF